MDLNENPPVTTTDVIFEPLYLNFFLPPKFPLRSTDTSFAIKLVLSKIGQIAHEVDICVGKKRYIVE